jgi:hypothetical protein
MTGTQCHIDGDKNISNTCNCDAQTATTCRVHSVYVDHANNCQPRRSKTLASTLAAPALVLHQASACRQQQIGRILHGQGNDACEKGAPPNSTSLRSPCTRLAHAHQDSSTTTDNITPPNHHQHCQRIPPTHTQLPLQETSPCSAHSILH